MTRESYDVFISYKSEDLELAELLNERLITAGFRVWFDRIRLQPGFRWHEEIESGCENSRVLLPVLTPRWKTSIWTRFETYGAEAVIPLHCEGSWEEVATPPLLRYQSAVIDLRAGGELAWGRLVAAIQMVRERPEPVKPERMAHIPLRPNPDFTGRENELTRVHEAIHRGPTTDLTRGSVFAITAMDGTGKTTLVRQYAEKFWRLYPQIFWVDAQGDLVPGFADIGRILRPDLASQPDGTMARCALQALSDRTERLLILDNAASENEVTDWIPKTGGCHTIITSHFAAWSPAVGNIPLYLLDREPSRNLLLKRSGLADTSENREAADRLAAVLDYLPLALEQASAYIRQEGVGFGFDDYLEIYRGSAPDLLGNRPLGSGDYPDTVASVWKTTLERLSWDARAALRLSAYLASGPIPKTMFFSSGDTVRSLAGFLRLMATGVPPSETGTEASEAYIRNVLQELARYSMINNLGQAFTVHSLVQMVERIGTPDSEREQCLVGSLGLVRTAVPDDMRDVDKWPDWRTWSAHAQVVIARAEEEGEASSLEDLYAVTGGWLEKMASFPAAESMLRKVLDVDRSGRDREPAVVAVRLNNLGGLLRTVGRFPEAEELFDDALRILHGACGDDHELMSTIRGNLGLVYRATGRFQRAEEMFRRALDSVERNRPDDSRTMATLLTNLADIMVETNRLSRADEYLQRALTLDEASVGSNHPDFAKALVNQATFLVAANRFVEAERNCVRALAIVETTYGTDHPEVAVCLNGLARAYQERGLLDEAETRFVRALDIDLEVFGPGHVKVAIRLNNLAGLMKAAGRLADAETAMRRSLAIRDKVLGRDNPLTFHMYGRLADVLRRRKKFEEAEILAREAVACWSRSEVPRVYKAGRALRALALVMEDTGRPGEAVQVITEAESIYEGALSADDPRFIALHRDIERISAAADTPAAGSRSTSDFSGKGRSTGSIVAITGHRRLADEAAIAAGLAVVLSDLSVDGPVTLLSPLAEGVDRLAVRELLRLPGGMFHAVLPLPPDDYQKSFVGEESRTVFRDLLAQATKVEILPARPTLPESYRAVGCHIIESCDILLAVWDGLPARGMGGTAEVISCARERGKPLIIIDSGNPALITCERLPETGGWRSP